METLGCSYKVNRFLIGNRCFSRMWAKTLKKEQCPKLHNGCIQYSWWICIVILLSINMGSFKFTKNPTQLTFLTEFSLNNLVLLKSFEIMPWTKQLVHYWKFGLLINIWCPKWAVWPDWAIYWTLGKFLKP